MLVSFHSRVHRRENLKWSLMPLELRNMLEGRIDCLSLQWVSSSLMFFINLVYYLGSLSLLLSHFLVRNILIRTHLVAIKIIKALTWNSEIKSSEGQFQSCIRFHLQGVERAYSLVLYCIRTENWTIHLPTSLLLFLGTKFWEVEWLMTELFCIVGHLVNLEILSVCHLYR